MAGMPFLPNYQRIPGYRESLGQGLPQDSGASIIGEYGPWAASLPEDPPQLSFRNHVFNDIESWKTSGLLDKAKI